MGIENYTNHWETIGKSIVSHGSSFHIYWYPFSILCRMILCFLFPVLCFLFPVSPFPVFCSYVNHAGLVWGISIKIAWTAWYENAFRRLRAPIPSPHPRRFDMLLWFYAIMFFYAILCNSMQIYDFMLLYASVMQRYAALCSVMQRYAALCSILLIYVYLWCLWLFMLFMILWLYVFLWFHDFMLFMHVY